MMRGTARAAFAAALAAATLGAGALLWATAIARWRMAVVGTIGWSAFEQVLAGVALLGGGAAGLLLRPTRHGRLLIGALLVTAAGTALAAVAWLPPAVAATPAAALPTVALPLGAIGLAIGSMLGRVERAAGPLAAALAGGGAVALCGLRLQALATWFAVLATAALLLVLAGAAMPQAPTRDTRAAAGSGTPLPSAALPLGAMLVLGAQRAATPTVAWTPALLVALFAAAVWLGTVAPAHQRSRLAAVAIAVLAAGVGAASPFRPLGADLLAPACAAGLLLAYALGGQRDAGGRGVIALLLGAGLAVVAVVVDAPPPLAMGLAALVPLVRLLRATAVAFAALAVALAVPVVRTATATTAPAHEVLLARAGPAAALYRARTQDVVVAVAARDLDRRGPDRPHAALLAALARAFAAGGPVVVLGSGTGRIAELFADLGPEQVLAVEPCAAVAALQPWLAVDGPVPPRRPGAAGAGCAMGSREFAWSVAAGSCAVLVCAEPLSAVAPTRAAFEEHAALRHAARDGAVLQAFELDATPPGLLATALAAAAAVHPWCGVFVSGHAGAIVGLAQAPDWPRAGARLDLLPDAVRWALHEAGIGGIGDCADALLGVLPPPANVRGDDSVLATAGALDAGDGALAPDVTASAEVLRKALGAACPAGTTAAARLALWSTSESQRDAALLALLARARARPDSVLLSRECAAALRADAERRIAAADPGQPDQVAAAAALAARFTHVGSPSAVLQAALALAPRQGEAVRTAASGGCAALALDPGFAAAASPVLAPIVEGLPARSPLADFAQLPAGEQLAELATGDTTLAIALRARFPSRVAAALVERWRQQPLSLPALAALREIADPFVLDRAARVLAARAAPAELLQIWRKDLPATTPIRALADGPAAQRQALQVAIAGRTDPDSLELVRQGLVDGDLAVRTAAGAALFRSIGDRIVYDPEWPAERRTAAAAELAALYPRTPR